MAIKYCSRGYKILWTAIHDLLSIEIKSCVSEMRSWVHGTAEFKRAYLIDLYRFDHTGNNGGLNHAPWSS